MKLKPMKLKPSDYWRTDSRWHEPILQVFDGFTILDPCADADRGFPAHKHLTESEDGLASPWKANAVFMNPPFSQTNAWMQRLGTALDSREIQGAITLTLSGVLNNKRCSQVVDMATVFCLPLGRISFTPGHPELSDDHGFDRDVVFSFFGSSTRTDLFAQVFEQHGRILCH